MNDDQFVLSEIYKLVKFQNPEWTQLQIVHETNLVRWTFSEDHSKIALEMTGGNWVFAWDDLKGFSALVDEDREFDESFQEGKI